MPVERLFAPGAKVVLHGDPSARAPVWLVADGVAMMSTNAARPGSYQAEIVVRNELVRAVFGGALMPAYQR